MFFTAEAQRAQSVYIFSFAFLSKANEKKNYLCVLCDFAVKSNNYWNIDK